MAHSRSSRNWEQPSQRVPGVNTTQRSWTEPNGMHFTINTTSYVSPGFSFAINGGSSTCVSRSARPNLARPSTFNGGGLLGGALGLLDSVLSTKRQSQRGENPRVLHPRQSARQVHFDAIDESDSDDSYDDEESDHGHSTTPRPSVFGELKSKLKSGKTSKRSSQATARQQYTSASGGQQRRSSFDAESSDSSASESDSDASSSSFDTPRRFHASSRNSTILLELQLAAEHEKRAYLRAKRDFQLASQGTVIDSVYLQSLLDEVKLRERMYTQATRRLENSKKASRDAQSRSRARPMGAQQHFVRAQPETNVHGTRISNGIGAFQHPQTVNFDPTFDVFQTLGEFGTFAQNRNFDRLFAQMEADFGMSGPASGFPFTCTNERPQRRPGLASTSTAPTSEHMAYSTMPVPPIAPTFPKRLKREEAIKLYDAYSIRWRALADTDSAVPYPTRSLKAAALADPSTIAHPTAPDWSAEQIMQGNTQLFFLLAFKLQPLILSTGVVRFDRASAKEADSLALIAALKKEKMRWHSDRLGRRNGGGNLTNEGLQRDETARAVFHGVCALMKLATGKT